MTCLIIHGNTNQFTFANSIVAANASSEDLFQRPLTYIYVIHSSASKEELMQHRDWLAHLKISGIREAQLVEKIVDVEASEDSVTSFVGYLGSIVKGKSEELDLMIDLGNGTTFQRGMLATAAYVLDLRYQFMIDTRQLSRFPRPVEFLTSDTLRTMYIRCPDPTPLDKIAYLNLVEVIRYQRIIHEHSQRFLSVDTNVTHEKFFRENLLQCINLKLRADRQRDLARYRIAAASIAASVEELISQILRALQHKSSKTDHHTPTFGVSVEIIESLINRNAPKEFDRKFLSLFNSLMVHLRNSSTHQDRVFSDIERFKAGLAVKLAFPFIELYTDIVHPTLAPKGGPNTSRKFRRLDPGRANAGTKFYYGLDGDNTGRVLEELFVSTTDENRFKRLSSSVSQAIQQIASMVKKQSGDAVIFAAGDDLLFKGYFNHDSLKTMQEIYKEASGLTCSIGYGQTLQDVYLALKMAKAEPGKNSIIGVEST